MKYLVTCLVTSVEGYHIEANSENEAIEKLKSMDCDEPIFDECQDVDNFIAEKLEAEND